MNKLIKKYIEIKISLIIISVLSSLTFIGASPVKFNISDNKMEKNYAEGEILVKFRNRVSLQSRENAISRKGDVSLRSLTKRSIMHIKLGKDKSVEAAVAEYNKNPEIEYAQPNFIYKTQAVPNDSSYGQLWGLHNTGQTISDGSYPTNNPGTAGADMGMESAWDVITDCSSVVVAVIDSGVNYNHNDLASNMWDDGSGNHGYDYVDDDNDPMDLNGHGTHCAGTIGAAGNDSTGSTGVCWQARIMAVRVMDATGNGFTSNIIQGIEYAVDNSAKVLNMSLGGRVFNPAYYDAISYARDNDVIVVAAAGNFAENNDITPHYPSSYDHDNIIAVAALDQAYALADFSHWGSASVDVGAPGTNVLSTWNGEHTTTIDNFTIDSNNWEITGNQDWSSRYLNFGSNGYLDTLSNPADWDNDSALYDENTDSKIYKNLGPFESSIDAGVLSFLSCFDVGQNDYFRINYKLGTGDPFDGGSNIFEFHDIWTEETFISYEIDISDFVDSSNYTVGFQLETGDYDTRWDCYGVAVILFEIETTILNNITYNTINGTSMATPHVAGLVAMIWAYNPDYTYSDVINSINNGGDSVPALSGKTTTGKAVDAFGSLCYINQPTGVTAVLD